MDTERATTPADAECAEVEVDYWGRHVRVEREPASRNPHPRGRGFRILSRLARASEDVEPGGSHHVLAS